MLKMTPADNIQTKYWLGRNGPEFQSWLKRGHILTCGRFHQHFEHSFYMRRSQKCKKPDGLTVFFALWGSAFIKVERKMVMKLTPAENFSDFLSNEF